MNIKNLETNGYTTFPYPEKLKNAVIFSMESWKKFCRLDENIKKSLPYTNNADGVGYELKNGVGKNSDKKENFDITTIGKDFLLKNSAEITEPVLSEFLKSSTNLVSLMKPLILGFAKQVELEFGIDGFEKEVNESESSFFVRFIHYFGDRELGEETATPHVDQSGFALHLFESAPGFQYLPYKGDWKELLYNSGEAVIFPGMQLQLRSNGRIKALCHRVIATKETQKSGRFSAVCFVQLKNTSKYDKDTHGRLQEKKPGFNYHLEKEEFKNFFKK